MKRTLTIVLVTTAATVVLLANAAAGSVTTIGDTAESWYTTAATLPCTAPVGCAPEPATVGSAYPAGTLHVGVAGGTETGRTYVDLDVASLTLASVRSATLHLPLAADSVGNQNPTSAALIICLATAAIPNGVNGSTAAPPPTDCAQSAHASYDAKRNEFTADITQVIRAWQTAQTPYGIAIMPAPGTTPTDNWQISFAGAAATDTAHVHTDVELTGTILTVTAPEAGPPTPPEAEAIPMRPPGAVPLATPGGATTPPAVGAVLRSSTVETVATSSHRTLHVAFPIGTFLILPLLLGVGAVAAFQLLTSPLLLPTPASRSPRDVDVQSLGAT